MWTLLNREKKTTEVKANFNQQDLIAKPKPWKKNLDNCEAWVCSIEEFNRHHHKYGGACVCKTITKREHNTNQTTEQNRQTEQIVDVHCK